MKLVMTLLVRDEADIVAINVEYHLSRGVDFIIATDNLSVDGTREILERYRDRGVLHLIDERGDDYSQAKWVTHMARMACVEFGADWVINNDADEFWWPEFGADLKDVLRELPAGTDAVSAPRHNFVPRPQTTGVNFTETMTVRQAFSINALGVPELPKVCHRAFQDIEVDQGNHGVRRTGSALEAPMAPLSILHFPLRTYPQFANKISLGGAAYERNSNLAPNIGRTWRILHEIFKRGDLEKFYKSQMKHDAEVERGLSEQWLVSDDRLKDFARRHGLADAH